jgi:hypothetical protein
MWLLAWDKEQTMKKFKVIGSYTIQTLYSRTFEISAWDVLKNSNLHDYIADLAHADEAEGLENWEVDHEKVIGDSFYIEEIIPIAD